MQDLNIKSLNIPNSYILKIGYGFLFFFLREWEAQGDLALFTVSILIP